MDLPNFPYHPNPVKTGVFALSAATCEACGHGRGYQYMGPIYPDHGRLIPICPWCIANGNGHSILKLKFAVEDLVVACDGKGVPQQVKDEICQRTPGFNTWQDQVWLSHCHDAAVFLGACSGETIRCEHPEVIDDIIESYCGEDEDIDEYVDSLEEEGGWLVARIFQCRHCNKKLVHIEAD